MQPIFNIGVHEDVVAMFDSAAAFRRYTGLTPYQYFLQLRIHRAKELLSDPDVQVKEVAARLRFDNQYYFARLFKKKTGVTPSAWRERVREAGSAPRREAAVPVTRTSATATPSRAEARA